MSLWRTHRAVVAPAGLAAAIALGLYATSEEPSPSASTAAAGEEAGESEAALRARLERARLEHKLSSLESEVESLRRGGEDGEGSAAEAASPLAAEALSSTAAPLDEAERQRRRDQEEEKVFAQIGEHFSAQPVDPGWAAEMTKRFDDHLRGRPAGAFQMEQLECRSSACRLELSVRSEADLGAIRDDLRYGMADVMGTGASKRDEDGHFVLYFAKDPQALGI